MSRRESRVKWRVINWSIGFLRVMACKWAWNRPYICEKCKISENLPTRIMKYGYLVGSSAFSHCNNFLTDDRRLLRKEDLEKLLWLFSVFITKLTSIGCFLFEQNIFQILTIILIVFTVFVTPNRKLLIFRSKLSDFISKKKVKNFVFQFQNVTLEKN